MTDKKTQWSTDEKVRDAMQSAFEDYNNDRIHSSLGYATPSEFAELWQQCEAQKPAGKRIIGGGKCA